MSTFKEIPNHEERTCATCRFYDGRCNNHDSAYWLEKKQEDATCKEHQLPDTKTGSLFG